MTTTNTNIGQLELGFNGNLPRPSAKRRETRITRAQWWFSKMREAVASAMDWQDAGTPPPEQLWMPGANREVKV